MAGILAATISSSDSYLLIAASAFAKNIYQGLLHRKATDKQVMIISRIALLAITAIAIVIALDENSVIFTIVSFAWAGFGATFGPLMLFSLFWKRTNRAGAIAGMIGGGSMVFVWNLLISPLGGIGISTSCCPRSCSPACASWWFPCSPHRRPRRSRRSSTRSVRARCKSVQQEKYRKASFTLAFLRHYRKKEIQSTPCALDLSVFSIVSEGMDGPRLMLSSHRKPPEHPTKFGTDFIQGIFLTGFISGSISNDTRRFPANFRSFLNKKRPKARFRTLGPDWFFW